MDKIALLLATALLYNPVAFSSSSKCRPKAKEYSCKKIKNAKREFFCSKRKKLSKKSIVKRCKTPKKKRAHTKPS